MSPGESVPGVPLHRSSLDQLMLQASISGRALARGLRHLPFVVSALLLALAAAHAHAPHVPVRCAHPHPQANTLRALAFESANVGYAVGHLGASLRTDDAGRTWHDQSDPAHFAINLEGLLLLEPGVLLAVGDSPGIFRSIDGGR